MTLRDVAAPTTAPLLLQPVAGLLLGGRYRLERPLGRGGMASVWRARDECLARDVAVKVFDRAAALEDDFTARHSMEVRLLARLCHRGVVAIYDAQRVDDAVAYLVMELVDGQTLRQLVAGGPLPGTTVRSIGTQLADALAYVHGCGIVHRDVKPANVLVADDDGEFVAKLTDFGVARMLDGHRMTVEGTTVGTANYLSPEQTKGADVGPPSDIYSLGLVLLEALTGVAAYPGHGVEAALARLSRPPLIPERLDREWGGLLNAMTAFEPADRPDAAEVARGLRAIDAGGAADLAPIPDVVPEPGPRTALLPPLPLAAPVRHRPRRTAWVASAAALVGACAAALVMLALGSSSAAPPAPPDAPKAVATQGADTHSSSLARDLQVAAVSTHAPATTHSATHAVAARDKPAKQVKRPPAEHGPPAKHGPGEGRGHGHGHHG